MKATVSGVLEDLTFRILEGSDQNLSFPESALLAVSATQYLDTLKSKKILNHLISILSPSGMMCQ